MAGWIGWHKTAAVGRHSPGKDHISFVILEMKLGSLHRMKIDQEDFTEKLKRLEFHFSASYFHAIRAALS